MKKPGPHIDFKLTRLLWYRPKIPLVGSDKPFIGNKDRRNTNCDDSHSQPILTHAESVDIFTTYAMCMGKLHARESKNGGIFTVYELLITIFVIGIVLTIGISNFSKFTQNS